MSEYVSKCPNVEEIQCFQHSDIYSDMFWGGMSESFFSVHQHLGRIRTCCTYTVGESRPKFFFF